MKNYLLLLLALTTSKALSNDLKTQTENEILSALKCEKKDSSEILNSFRHLKQKKSELEKVGLTYVETGEDLDEKITITFVNPVQFYGSKTQKAELTVDGDFIVSAVFHGDPEKIIQALKLKKFKGQKTNDYLNMKPSKTDCPPTQRLRKINSQEFKFGCGWCNG